MFEYLSYILGVGRTNHGRVNSQLVANPIFSAPVLPLRIADDVLLSDFWADHAVHLVREPHAIRSRFEKGKHKNTGTLEPDFPAILSGQFRQFQARGHGMR